LSINRRSARADRCLILSSCCVHGRKRPVWSCGVVDWIGRPLNEQPVAWSADLNYIVVSLTFVGKLQNQNLRAHTTRGTLGRMRRLWHQAGRTLLGYCSLCTSPLGTPRIILDILRTPLSTLSTLANTFQGMGQ